jgi:hypothetical protein
MFGMWLEKIWTKESIKMCIEPHCCQRWMRKKTEVSSWDILMSFIFIRYEIVIFQFKLKTSQLRYARWISIVSWFLLLSIRLLCWTTFTIDSFWHEHNWENCVYNLKNLNWLLLKIVERNIQRTSFIFLQAFHHLLSVQRHKRLISNFSEQH